MRAILLAAGLGTRLRPITDTTPKCLVPINGKPLIDYWLEQLTKAGIEKFLRWFSKMYDPPDPLGKRVTHRMHKRECDAPSPKKE